MLTGSLAMLHRALRLDARLVRTHLFRFGFALLIWISMMAAAVTSLAFGAPGLRMFDSLMQLNMILIVLAGVSFFATAITEEKEEETLGLLMMAGLNPLGILLGKSTSRLVGALLLLVVQFPFTLLAITLGGVTLRQIIASYCALAAFLLLLANIGLFCSVVCKRGGNASAMALLLILFHFFASYLLAAAGAGLALAGLIEPQGGIAGAIQSLSALAAEASVRNRLSAILVTGFSEGIVGFQAVVSLALSAMFFLAAWAGFNAFTRPDRDSAAYRLGRLFRRGRAEGSVPAPRQSGRTGRVRPGMHAIAWKDFHFVTGGTRALLAKFVLYGFVSATVLWFCFRYDYNNRDNAGGYIVMAMLGAFLIEGSIYASRIFHDEWRDRTLPLLMMLPISTPRIVYSKVVGCLPAFLPALCWLALGLVIWPRGPELAFQTAIRPSHWAPGLVFVLFLTLTAFFSLVVRWGALPLAVAVMVVGSGVSSCCLSPVLVVFGTFGNQTLGEEGAALCIDAVIALLIAGLQFDIHRRLEITASR